MASTPASSSPCGSSSSFVLGPSVQLFVFGRGRPLPGGFDVVTGGEAVVVGQSVTVDAGLMQVFLIGCGCLFKFLAISFR